MLSAESCIEVVVPETAAPARSVAARPVRSAATLLPITTLVVWAGCLTVGALGLALPYTRPVVPKPAAVVTQAELLNVELTNDPLPPVDPQPSSAITPPPPLEPMPAPANVPPLMAVAAANANVAFALPVEGPVQVVNAAQASYTRPTEQAVATAAAPVQSLTYGVGDGRQPAPMYPREAARAGQEGRVNVRFSVGENGRVLAAEAAAPSPWPLLNEEAVRTVRSRWRFRNGPVRVYEVTIRFELQKSRGEL